MKRIAVSILALTVAGTGAAVSQELTEDIGGTGLVSADDMNRLIRSENIIGSPIYTLSTEAYEGGWEESPYYGEWEETDYYEEVDSEWEQVGEVSDIVLSRDGQLVGMIAEVGGWLDIGDSEVVLDLRDLKLAGGMGAGVGADDELGLDEGAGLGEDEEAFAEEEGLGEDEAVGEGLGAGSDIAFVTRYSEEQLENMEGIDEGWF